MSITSILYFISFILLRGNS